MDAYLPIHDTLQPSVSVSANDEPWKPLTGTRTLLWYTAPAHARMSSGSSTGRPVSFFIIGEHPAAAGLERLRKFKGWPDNWDAEGAKAPRDKAVDFATKVFGLLSSHRIPSVTLDVDGNPMFVYEGQHRGEIVITGDQTFDYFFHADDAPEKEDATLSEGYLPSELISYISSAA